jgi:hypothetical protein
VRSTLLAICCPLRSRDHLTTFSKPSDRREVAQLALLTSRGSDAPALLLKAARRLEPIDAERSRATYLQALSSGYFVGRLATGGGVLEVARAAGTAPPATRAPRAPDLLLDGLVAHYNQGYAAGLPILRKALKAFGARMPVDEELRWHLAPDRNGSRRRPSRTPNNAANP